MNSLLKTALAVAALAISAQAAAAITLYERQDFEGPSFTTAKQVGNFEGFGFNDRASSVVVVRERWEICEAAGFAGRCVVLRPGSYPSLAAMGLNDRISSVRAVSKDARIDDNRYAPAPKTAQVNFYENPGFGGRSFVTEKPIGDFRKFGFNDRASSVVVLGNRWEACEGAAYGGRCVVLRPGSYPSLAAMGLNDRVSSVRIISWNARVNDDRYGPAPMTAQVTFYENASFGGRSFTTEKPIGDFQKFGFNDRASSVVVLGSRWEACEAAGYGGHCVVLRPGRYPSLAAMGLNNRVSSVRIISWNARVNDNRYAPAPVAAYDARRRNNERLYEANVTSVRAVVGPPEQRCWVEREQVVQDQDPASIAAVISGILGYQIADGQPEYQDVRRCASVPSQSRPDHWDVTYQFRGKAHRIQTTAPPGPTVTVNELGEPRA